MKRQNTITPKLKTETNKKLLLKCHDHKLHKHLKRQHADGTIKLEENRNAYTDKAITDFKIAKTTKTATSTDICLGGYTIKMVEILNKANKLF